MATAIASTLQFSAATFSVSEGVGAAIITVTRNNPSAAASINYATVDNDAAVRCDDQVNNQGAAFARCDYATTIDTLRFAPGETSKTFTVPIVNDTARRRNRDCSVDFEWAQGAVIGPQASATLTITDNDTAGGS